MSSETIAQLLGAEIGLAAPTLGDRTLAAAVANRRRATGDDEDAYLERLRSSPEERAALVDEVVVPETWFFRDVEPFKVLAKAAAGWHDREAKGRPIRLLSLPCSSGEEAYSMAIALVDAGILPWRFEILGVDVSARALARAQRASYGRLSFRGSDLTYRDRHLEEREGEWTVNRALRERVRFARGNVLNLAATTEIFGAFDAIFCRNLLIYLTSDARQAALQGLLARLPPHGLFVLGHADAIDARAFGLTPTSDAGAFAYTRGGPEPRRAAGSRSSVPGLTSSVPTRTPTGSSLRPSSAITPAPLPARPPSAVGMPVPAPAPVAPAELLARAQALADAGALADAAAVLEPHLDKFGADAAPYHLLGVIAHARGDVAKATMLFEKALYCDPEHRTALLHLALLAEARGDRAVAEQLRKRAARAGARRGGPK